MPEEKKEKKVVPFVAPGNEAKKDSFTFSDKIKNSKPAASKSFANRISSKIGSDGKPKKTLFERTKRDAPFFIAAIVALLLLPFLYKYSGNVDEDPAMVTPATEDTPFDPTRSGFDTLTGDPEEQIAPLSGRDPLSLIRGLGGKKEEVSDELPFRSDLASGLDDDFASSNNNTKEYNETNIHRYKKQAAPATRAAFKKTNINPIRNAGMTSRPGSKLGVGMWGGSLKKAANKVKPDAPKSSPKPVSLQPLQAAGKPSRSYFGQGAAAEARRSKEAMSSADARKALMDAQMRPIEPGKIGGITGGDFGGPGGGNGKLERNFAFNGKEPWWWDMMKQRSQMEWKAKFDRKWDWIKWKDKLAQKLADGLLSCLITGTDDWSMGKMFGAKEGSGKETKCNKYTAETWKTCQDCMAKGPFSKASCWALFNYTGAEGQKDPWSEGNPASSDMNMFEVRWDCMTNGVFDARKARKAAEGFAETNDCNTFYKDGRYVATANGNYSVFHYVVGVRSADWNQYVNGSDEDRYNLLYVGYVGRGNTFSVNPNTTGQLVNQKSFIPLFIESVAVKSKKVKKKGVGTKADTKALNEDGKDDAEDRMAVLITKDCKRERNAKTGVDELQCTRKAANLKYADLLAKLRKGGLQFGNQDESGTSSVLMSVKGSKYGKGWVTGARCAYPMAFVSCHDTAVAADNFGDLNTVGNPAAFLSFPNVGKETVRTTAAADIQKLFRVTYRVENRLNTDEKSTSPGYFVQTIDNTEGYVPNEVLAKNGDRKIGDKYNIAASGKGAQAVRNAMGDEKDATKSAVVTWEIRQCWDATVPWSFGRTIADGACGRTWNDKINGVNAKELPGIVVSSATCVYGDEGEVPGGDGTLVPPEPDKDNCKGNPDASAACCTKLGVPGSVYKGGKCVPPGGDGNGDNETLTGLFLSDTVSNIPNKFDSRPVQFPNIGGKATAQVFQACKLPDIDNQNVYNQPAAQAYVKTVLESVNTSQTFIKAHTRMHHHDDVTVANLVDAMTLAYQQNARAQVPQEVVCSMGKTIGARAKDPDIPTKNNMFGAFAAYIDKDSSFFPAARTYPDNTQDSRFYGCSHGQTRGVGAKYHYGSYNWNEKQLGDLKKYGPEGRDWYLNVLAGNKGFYWGKPGDFPLAAIGRSLNFQITRGPLTAQQLNAAKRNGTLDDYNRKNYHETYQTLYRNLQDLETGCGGLQGNMNVSDALEYIGRVCSNGPRAKPENGHTACGIKYGESPVMGTN